MSDKDKPQGKVEIKIGNMTFSGEGDQEWLGEQVAKVIAAATTSQIELAEGGLKKDGNVTVPSAGAGGSLASYIKAKGGETNQVIRFLATAGWLYRRGQTDLSAKSVARALLENHQKKLANPADCLNKNVSKGHCEKIKDTGFFITPEGWSSLGETQ